MADFDLSEKLVHLRIKDKDKEKTNVLLPVTTFEASGLPQEYIKKLLEAGFKEPTLIQARSWPIAMKGGDMIAVSKTGSRKKLGFLIPGFMHIKLLQNDREKGPTMLVLCPTDDIATAVHTEAVKFGASAGIRTIFMRGEATKELEEGFDVIVATPEPLANILEEEQFGGLKQVSYLVLYEADLLLSASVVPRIHQIVSYLPSKHRQTLVFTTTWPIEAKDIVASILHNPVTVSGDETRGYITDSISELGGSSGASNALFPKELRAPTKKKLLVLSINGILADIVRYDYWNSRQADINFNGKSVYKRPFCGDFLKFCFANFEVGIWSSRNMFNTRKVVDFLIGDLENKLLFCWDQSKCTTTGLKAKGTKDKPAFFKDLNKLWDKKVAGLPWQTGKFSETDTLLVDDAPYKGLRNPPYTAIFPYPYTFMNKDDKSLGVGGDLRLYLEKLVAAEDVQCYVKNNPFGQPLMTASHPDWNYYLPAMKP